MSKWILIIFFLKFLTVLLLNGTGYSCSLPAEDLPAACERQKEKPSPDAAGEGKSNCDGLKTK